VVTRTVEEARSYVSSALEALGDPSKATQMQAYMKTTMPFHGVQKAARAPVLRQLVREYRVGSGPEYREMVLGVWTLPHREEKYLALGYARHFTLFIDPLQLPLYKRLIIEAAWWDLVDEVATKLIRHLVLEFPNESWPVVDTWVEDEDIWLRRSAIICQVGAKERTDPARLFSYCESRASEKGFFIRKAIGWALREYSKTDPLAVAAFVNSHASDLSGLSFREASRLFPHLIDQR